ncbi:MAG: sigma-70 family RNA polymerase sigma factor [Thermoguttaceae bacterium]
MAGRPAGLETELAAAFEAHRAALRRYLQQAFFRLRDQADDFLQEAVKQTLDRIRAEAFCPQVGWIAWLRRGARNRAVDFLRSWERRLFRQLPWASPPEASGLSSGTGCGERGPLEAGAGPESRLAEAERRGRQGLLLSQVLEEFVRWCEARPERLAIKEAYERSIRGQKPAEIAAAMEISADRVSQLLNRGRERVFKRVGRADVDHSVFVTLHRRKPDKGP